MTKKAKKRTYLKNTYSETSDKRGRRVKITTGPFLVPLEVDSEIQVGRDNDRLIIILENPSSKKKLKASIKLSICLQPESDDSICEDILIFEDMPEIEIDLGTYVLKPHTCTRIERIVPGEVGYGTDERNAIYRVTAKGHFNICKKNCQPMGGLLEMSVIVGSIFNPLEPGLEQADSATFFRYKDLFFIEE